MISLPVLHFSDVYRVSKQKLAGGIEIDCTQFAYMLHSLRAKWPVRCPSIATAKPASSRHSTNPESTAAAHDGDERDGLVLFSGDLFSPSIESSVTRGSHMVPVIDHLAPDVAVVGNHEFDFGYPHLTKLIADLKFPWLLSNVVDENTLKVPEGLHESVVLERCGVRIGFIGLIEEEWISTVTSWPSNFVYKDLVEVCLDLSKRLRDPNGSYRCDVIFALTHSMLPCDISLARSVHATSPSHQSSTHANIHGADMIFGGHDHDYYVSRGVTEWEGLDRSTLPPSAERDEGDVLILKSGTDFRELSELIIELEDTPSGSIRRKVIKAVRGKRHVTKSDMPSSEHLKSTLSIVLGRVSRSLRVSVCRLDEPLDLRSVYTRTTETAACDWFADVLHHAYDDALCLLGRNGADGAILTSGAFRGDTIYGPGTLTLRDIFEILPFGNSAVMCELDGWTVWEALETGLSLWPAQAGRFPVIAGFHVEWDSRNLPGERVVSVRLKVHEPVVGHRNGGIIPNDVEVKFEEVKRKRGGRKYAVVTREYQTMGGDSYTCLMNQPMLVSAEQGMMLSQIVHKYLLDRKYINKMVKASPEDQKAYKHLHAETKVMLKRERQRSQRIQNSEAALEKAQEHEWQAADKTVHVSSPRSYRESSSIASREHMTNMGIFDGEARSASCSGSNSFSQSQEGDDEGLVIVSPVKDGRLRDIARDND